MQSNGASLTTLNAPVASNTMATTTTAGSSSKGKSSGSKFKSLFQKLQHRGQPSGSAAHGGTVNGRTGSPPATASATSTSTSTGKHSSQKSTQKALQSNANAVRGSQTASTTSSGPASASSPDLPKSPSPAQQVKDAANRDSRKSPLNGTTMDVSSGSRRKDAIASTSNTSYTNADHSTASDNEYLEPGEEDGADANASLRPHTPSTIDASSSFTGSRRNSNGSLAPTSRTFKSFVTGHSKTSASTKPTTLATASNANPASTSVESNAVAGAADADMREGGANRIATQMHESDAKDASVLAPATGQISSVKPSPLRNSIEGIPMIAHEERGQSLNSGSPSTSTGGHLDRPTLTSSNSITFSALPPASPLLQQQASTPTSPLMPSSASVRSFANSLNGPNGPSGSLTHYPRHSHHDPKNNPRASSPPPDNASILTLASSTAPSVYGSVRTPGAGGSIAESGRVHHKSSLGGLGAANEDASIRAIPPSRRESGESFGSKWSAAILSTRDTNRDGKESFYTASVMNAEQ